MPHVHAYYKEAMQLWWYLPRLQEERKTPSISQRYPHVCIYASHMYDYACIVVMQKRLYPHNYHMYTCTAYMGIHMLWSCAHAYAEVHTMQLGHTVDGKQLQALRQCMSNSNASVDYYTYSIAWCNVCHICWLCTRMSYHCTVGCMYSNELHYCTWCVVTYACIVYACTCIHHMHTMYMHMLCTCMVISKTSPADPVSSGSGCR